MMRHLSLALALTIGIAASASAAEITNPESCDFDGDGVADTLTVDGRRGTAVLSKNGKSVRVRFAAAYSTFTCRDANDDDKMEIYARKRQNGRAKIYYVGRSSSSGLSKVCKSINELRSCHIWKSQQSSHISKGDPRHRSTGFITTRGCPGSFPNPILAYDSNGTLIHKLGEYFPTGSAYDSRHYGCFGGGDCKGPVAIAVEARQKTGKEEIYLKNTAGECFRVPDPGQCYNSSGC